MSMNEEAGTVYEGPRRKSDGSTQPSELVDQVVDATKNLSSVFGTEARAMAGRLTEQLSETAEAGVERGVDTLAGLVRAMQVAGKEIQPESPGLARSIDEMAAQVENFADTIRGRSISDLISGAAELAKRNPTLFIAGAVAAGFAVSRFVRSSAPSGEDNQNQFEG